MLGVDTLSLPKDAVIIFDHPAVSRKLYIHSGATAITWAYTLNTQSTPTIGGEVIQVLSAFAGPMQITGQTAGLLTSESGQFGPNQVRGWKKIGGRDNYSPNDELKDIVEWFREYMVAAGATTRGNKNRDQRSIFFTYPARNWRFEIMVTALDGFRYDKEVISPQWSITAEIVSDSAVNFFSGITMSSFTDDLITNQSMLGTLGLSAFANSGTELNNNAFGQTGGTGSTDPFLNPALGESLDAATKKMGDNFQSLVAAWSSGTFADFGFGALLDNTTLPSNVDDVYTKIFGSSQIGDQGSSASSSTTSGSFTYGGSSPQGSVAVKIANAFSSAGMPPELGVAIAIHESSLNPDARSPNDGGPGVDGVGLFQAHNPGGADGSQACRLASSVDRSDPPTKNYPEDTQIANAVQWISAAKPSGFPSTGLSNDQLAQWAFSAQRGVNYTIGNTTTGACTNTFSSQIAQAKSVIAGFSQSSGATGLRGSVLSWANKMLAYAAQTGKPTYDEGCRRDVENITPGDFASLPTSDCSNSVALLYCWGTNNNHAYGTATPGFNDSNTATIWARWQHNEIQPSQAKAGDLVIWGTGPGAGQSEHVAMLMQDYAGDATTMFSDGGGSSGKAPPGTISLGNENAAHSVPPHFFSILP